MEQTELTALLARAAARLSENRPDEAFELYARAAEEGSAEAEYYLGRLWEEAECDFMEESDDFQTYSNAEDYYTAAADKGYSKAALALAKLYASNSSYRASCFEEALQWYRRAAELGEAEAIEYMAAYEEAVRTQKAADEGDPEAMLKTAELLFAGRYLKWDTHLAKSYLAAAAEKDYLPGVEAYAERLYRSRNPKEAAKWFERAFELGSEKIIMRLAYLYADDYGAGRNAERAKELYLLALGKGETEALDRLGHLYSRDPDLYDPDVALKYFEEYEARTGKHPSGADDIDRISQLCDRFQREADAEAAFLLGEAFEYEGRGVPRDYFQKRKWYERAAELGHVKAMEKTADAYYFGKGGNRKDEEVNLEKAAYWYERAAENGQKFAIERLAFMYHDGEGVERDLKRSIHWMELVKDDFYLGRSAKQLLQKWKKELEED